MKTDFSEQKNVKIDIFSKLGITLGASLVILIFSLCAPPEADLFDKLGMELAVLALGVFLCRFPPHICLLANLFVLSSAAGSILKVYDKVPGYDRVVHFISGIILCYMGMYMARWLFRRLKVPENPLLIILAGGLFAFSCAGFWEIIEFTVDCIMHVDAQHGNSDSMGDIVAGFLGGVVYQIHEVRENRAYFTKEWLKNFLDGTVVSLLWKKPSDKGDTADGAHQPKLHL